MLRWVYEEENVGLLATVLMVWASLAMLVPAPVMADIPGGDCGASEFWGFDRGMISFVKGRRLGHRSKVMNMELTQYIWVIVLNVLFDLVLAVGYLAIGFIIYGGYLYILCHKEIRRGRLEEKKDFNVSNCWYNYCALASVAVNTVRVILGINSSDSWKQDPFGQQQIQNAFNWAYSMAGVIAVIFIIKASFDYVMSRAILEKQRQRCKEIIYAVVGLVIVILAAAITAFVLSAINGAGA